MVWIFGYGSLVWKVGFEYERRLEGYIEGYKRRFWWWSEDHRGVPGAPGLVVTLLPTHDNADRVWGVAYKIGDSLWEQTVKAQLDHREKGGYTKHVVTFHPRDNSEASSKVTLYIGLDCNPLFAGPKSERESAEIIHRSVGPSGPNKEYLYNLAEAMRSIDNSDEYLYRLEALVKELDKKKEDAAAADKKRPP